MKTVILSAVLTAFLCPAQDKDEEQKKRKDAITKAVEELAKQKSYTLTSETKSDNQGGRGAAAGEQ